ncbi:protein-tyrosine phosphatase 1 [Pelomyxa schiedti]|nr:protein-tyrosine phosphatase 1 [Pelomyxa schiedti]
MQPRGHDTNTTNFDDDDQRQLGHLRPPPDEFSLSPASTSPTRSPLSPTIPSSSSAASATNARDSDGHGSPILDDHDETQTASTRSVLGSARNGNDNDNDNDSTHNDNSDECDDTQEVLMPLKRSHSLSLVSQCRGPTRSISSNSVRSMSPDSESAPAFPRKAVSPLRSEADDGSSIVPFSTLMASPPTSTCAPTVETYGSGLDAALERRPFCTMWNNGLDFMTPSSTEKEALQEILISLLDPVKPYTEFAFLGEPLTVEHGATGLQVYNRAKNRYPNVIPYEQTRVKLHAYDAIGSDYINASYIKDMSGNKAYIATQGPLPCTFPDFWRMTWETASFLIIMLTKEFEHATVKVDRYWPTPQEKSHEYGFMTVTLIGEEMFSKNSVIHRTFQITNSQHPGEIRTIEHYQYSGWPDHSVPSTTRHIRKLIQNISQHTDDTSNPTKRVRLASLPSCSSQVPSLPKPTIVHCSAGVGRTGTFCAIHISIEKLYHYIESNCTSLINHSPSPLPPTGESGEDWDIHLMKTSINVLRNMDMCNTVRSLRQQRPGMVQQQDQYSFGYCALQDEMVELGLIPDHLVAKLGQSRQLKKLPKPPTHRKAFGHSSPFTAPKTHTPSFTLHCS